MERKFFMVFLGLAAVSITASVLAYVAIVYGALWVLRHFGVLEAMGV